MIDVILALAVIGGLIAVGEFLQNSLDYHSEITRKFVHMSVATFAATWPLFMSWSSIELLSLLLFFGVLVSRHLSWFRSIHSITRLTWGELFFPMAIGIAAMFSQDGWVFAAAMLHLGLADGLAAVAGTLWGQNNRYKILGHTKSKVGTTAFFLCSFLIVLIFCVLNGPHSGFATLLWLPLLATAFENVGIAGSDNLIVPVTIVFLA